jgi:hypothetical protein
MEFLGFFEYFSVLKHVLEFLEIVFALKIFLEKIIKTYLIFLGRARRPNPHPADPTPLAQPLVYSGPTRPAVTPQVFGRVN